MNKMIIKGKMPWSLIKFFIYLFIFIYLFNHFHHMVRNTQQSEAPV